MTNGSSSTIVSKVWNYPPSFFELWRAGVHVLKLAAPAPPSSPPSKPNSTAKSPAPTVCGNPL